MSYIKATPGITAVLGRSSLDPGVKRLFDEVLTPTQRQLEAELGEHNLHTLAYQAAQIQGAIGLIKELRDKMEKARQNL